MTTPTDHHSDDEPLDLGARLTAWMENQGWFDPPPRRWPDQTPADAVADVLAEDHPRGEP